jgi:hypothetical protein
MRGFSPKFCAHFCAQSNYRQLANKGLNWFIRIRPARPTARANRFGLNYLEEQSLVWLARFSIFKPGFDSR